MELNVYPDRVHKLIIIETGNPMPSLFKLFDSMGSLLILKEVADNERISVNKFKKGLYHYKLISGPNLQTGKLIL
jgi:hypothetical protein